MPNQARFDNSCSQYVVLGLYSASLCGIDIPPTTWYACANHWNDTLLTYKGLREPLRLVSHGELARIREQSAQNKDSRTVVAARRIQVGGWAYLNETVNMNGDRKQRTPATASMTCAGITGAWISAAALRNRNIGKPQVIKLQRSAQQGFAWLHHHFDVRHNHPVGGWYYYYMYGLERAAELAQVALIGNRDWYFEGAEMLLGLQGDNGGFRGQLEDACFAILFLKQAAPPLPALTGK
jgi:hypothetical protein